MSKSQFKLELNGFSLLEAIVAIFCHIIFIIISFSGSRKLIKFGSYFFVASEMEHSSASQ